MNVDFLSLNPEDPKLKTITHLLVDPSCSGSGIPSRLDHLVPSTPEAEQLQRIRALSNFQLAIVSHALRFSGAKRVVYSTCSVWEMEDEGVVMRVLAKKEFQEKGWRLAPREEVVPGWERRGRVEACGGDACTFSFLSSSASTALSSGRAP
jgi:putative methyltransferase